MLTIILRRSLLSVHLVMQTCWVRVITGSIRKIAVKMHIYIDLPLCLPQISIPFQERGLSGDLSLSATGLYSF